MDISKQRPKGISIPNILTTTLLLLIITPKLLCASNTFYIEDIECQCSGTSAVCRGTSEDEDEVQRLLSNLLQNCSSTNDLLDLTLNIEKIETLPNKSFIFFKLQNLTLGYGLETLFQDAFDGLQSSLINLNLSHNDIEFYGSPFSMLENLKELNLDFNNLREQDFSTFGNINKLEILSISGNHLSFLQANFLENMTAIQSLIIDHNKNITSFSKINIVSSTLINLSAKHCAIEGSLENDSLSGIVNLKHVDFSSNKLIQVNAFALDKLHDLESLNLSYNKIETLKDYSFASLHNLLTLDLEGNEIKEIEVFSFVNLTKLRFLNLADNKLEVIMEKYTSDLYSLEKINLENNEIHIVMPGSFSTCRQLKELLLQGNAFHCDLCDLMYIVGFLTNDTLFKKEDADAITCAAPDEMKGIPLTKVPPESLDEICELDESTSEMSTNFVSTEKTTNDYTPISDSSFDHTDDLFSIDVSTLSGEMDTSSVTPIITPESTSEATDTSYETTRLSIISSTLPFPTVSGSTEISTEVTTLITESITGVKEISNDIIDITTELSSSMEKSETSSATDITLLSIPQTTTAKASETTENTSVLTDVSSESEVEKNTTTEIIMLAVSENNTAGNVGSSTQSTSESTTLPTTEGIKETTFPNTIEMTTSINKLTSILLPETEEKTISVTVTSTSIATELPLASSSKTDLYEEKTSQINTVSTQTDFPSTAVYNESIKVFTTTTLSTKKIPESQMIHIIDYSVSDDKICVKWVMKWKILSKQWIIKELKCNIEIQHSKGKQYVYFKNCPTSEDEIQECAIIENKYLNNMYRFCVNVYISHFKNLKSCSKYPPTTTEKSFNYSTIDSSTQKSQLPTKETFIPFKVLKFDATFNYPKSFVDINWIVNKNERNSICSLNLILMSHNFNYTEAVFGCKNNSYRIQNIKHEAFQVCLRNFYQGYYAPLLCKSSVPLSYEFKASTMKDDGYKNSALIAVICLLILIVLIIIVLLLKKLLKKRTVSDLYNVSAEEKNVLRRQASASFQQEPCVRYSYTLKEQIEI